MLSDQGIASVTATSTTDTTPALAISLAFVKFWLFFIKGKVTCRGGPRYSIQDSAASESALPAAALAAAALAAAALPAAALPAAALPAAALAAAALPAAALAAAALAAAALAAAALPAAALPAAALPAAATMLRPILVHLISARRAKCMSIASFYIRRCKVCRERNVEMLL
jgi:hypothetical protein